MKSGNSSGKRRHKRFVITLHAKVIIGEKTYAGVIGNVSEEGLSSTITTFIKTDEQFTPDRIIHLVFDLPSGDPVDLPCEIRWYLRPRDDAPTLILGLYILEPPSQYTKWISRFR
ncbi:MAG: PilZ domain-containing protein [Nitrospiraceae bacterium]|nr:MAG: PilZ domain-containing protein [Nitrospiraceae bacterium]